MDEEKKPSHKKRIFFLLLVAFLLIFIAVILVLGVKINFVFNDELIIKLSPLDKSLVTLYGQEKNMTFNFRNDNSILCKTRCTYEFKDISSNKTIDTETLILKPRTNITRSYNLLPSIYGSGHEIYLFEVRCNNIKSLLCGTNEEEQIKSSFVTLSYDLRQEERENLENANKILNDFLYNLSALDIKMQYLNHSLLLARPRLINTLFNTEFSFLNDHNNIIGSDFDKLNNISRYSMELWSYNKHDELRNTLSINQIPLDNLNDELNKQDERFSSMKEDYNKLAKNLTILVNNSIYTDSIIGYFNSTNSTLFLNKAIMFKKDLNDLIKEYNNKSSGYNNVNIKTNNLIEQLNNITLNANTTLAANNTINNLIFGIYEIQDINITFNSSIKTNISLPEPVCCVFGKCRPCCNVNTCSSDPRLYPVIFLHGHSFNSRSSPEISLNSFTKMQRKLQDDGLINAGQLDLKNLEDVPAGEYGKFGSPVSITATYYYINYYDIGGYKITTQKSERIENYALRLNEIIKKVKQRTGSEKVNIVAHSMGGLVAREYIRIFGPENVNKLVLIATPNYGVGGRVMGLCGFIGSEKECEDMSQDSIFLKRLNQYREPESVKVFTIAGSGCDTEKEDGDGIAVLNNVVLNYSTNYIINGTCTDILKSNLHQDIIDYEKYPETYNVLRAILKE
ncbi:MAG: alpha/beta fold hydrolase [Nanoarchaeota archaeon]